jgi:hypothetical protein
LRHRGEWAAGARIEMTMRMVDAGSRGRILRQ